VLGDSEGWWSWWITLHSGSFVGRLDEQEFAMVVAILNAFKKAKRNTLRLPVRIEGTWISFFLRA
jgi:hypothetical protein